MQVPYFIFFCFSLSFRKLWEKWASGPGCRMPAAGMRTRREATRTHPGQFVHSYIFLPTYVSMLRTNPILLPVAQFPAPICQNSRRRKVACERTAVGLRRVNVKSLSRRASCVIPWSISTPDQGLLSAEAEPPDLYLARDAPHGYLRMHTRSHIAGYGIEMVGAPGCLVWVCLSVLLDERHAT
jgi:hypothetical protein